MIPGKFHNFTIELLGADFLTTLFPFVLAWKPSFENILFGPFYLFKGIEARLPCQPFAKPYPTIKWLKDGVTLEYENNGSYILDSDGTLVIRKVGESDAGRYTCTAQNYLGEANKTADGILLGKESSKTVPFLFFAWLPANKKYDSQQGRHQAYLICYQYWVVVKRRYIPGACFSIAPRGFRTRKASCQTAI